MALLFVDSFDSYGNGSDPVTLGKWGGSAGGVLISNALARTGTLSARMGLSTGVLVSKAMTPSGGFVVGVAFQVSAAFIAQDLLRIREGATIHLAVGTTAGAVMVVKLGGTIIQTGTKVLSPLTWYYVEFKGTINNTTGSYELRVDGVTELSATNVDTQNGGTATWDTIYLGAVTGGITNWDDFYVCDQSGAAPRNTFLGPVKIECLLPQTDAVAAGTYAQLTPSTGTDHGALVDEVPPNTTDYNGSATVGLKDTYNYPPMTLTGTILGVQSNLYVLKSDASARSVCSTIRTGGADFDGANVSPGTTFGYIPTVFSTNPQTVAEWTVADIASLQVGMKVTV